MTRILIIEDDPAIGLGIEATLREQEFQPVVITDGREGYQAARSGAYDLLVLDLMLPSMTGQEICRELRQHKSVMPILMLTSRSMESDRVEGLEMGADDYLTKPFSIRELVARIRALLRRAAPPAPEADALILGDLQIDLRRKSAQRNGEHVEFTAREYRILKYFHDHADEVVTRQMLLDEVWGYDNYPTTRTVDNFILSLRKKIEPDPAHPAHIRTVHTVGYRFVPTRGGDDPAPPPPSAECAAPESPPSIAPQARSA